MIKIDVRKRAKDLEIQKQNRDLIRKTIELTELKGQLEDKNLDLEIANKQISKALEVKTRFINQAAHDLRTPLTPILTLIPLIKSRIKDKKTIDDITIVENNTKYLSIIVKELIALIKTEAKGYEYNLQKLNLKKLIVDIISNNNIIFHNNKIRIINKVTNNLPMIYADKYKLMELLQNIFSNAIQFMPNGGALTIVTKKIDNFINVSISDTGIGMTKKTLSRLFEEFFKADESRHYPGSGLGLSICKRIVEGHNGKIWAESQGLRKGSTIAFNIPIEQKAVYKK